MVYPRVDRVFILLTACGLSLPACSAEQADSQESEATVVKDRQGDVADASVFSIASLRTSPQLRWTVISTDPEGDGARPGRGDARDLSYRYDLETEEIWFRFRLYGDTVPLLPAVSLAIDADLDQETGTGWYGSVSDYTLDRLVSVGPRRRLEDGTYMGYNGITDADGIRARDWINVKEGTVAMYLEEGEPSIVVRVHRRDISAGQRVRILGSVGGGALWNDDIGAPATIDLSEPTRPEE